jgi:hypothetical protein
MQFQDDLAGGVVLIRPALQSPDFVSGTSGWQISIDGSAEFNDVVIRDTLQSDNYVAGVSGWKLDQDGTAELYELTARGSLESDNFVPGVSGWQILAAGTAEFSDLSIRSSDGSGSTVVVANGEIEILDGDDDTVVELDSSGYRLYSSTGSIVAEIKLDAGEGLGGFYTRNFVAPENTYSFLSGGEVIFGPVDNLVADNHGFLQYVLAPGVANPYAIQTLSTGSIDNTLDDPARIQLISERGQRPKVWVDGGSSSDAADLYVTGKVIQNGAGFTSLAGTYSGGWAAWGAPYYNPAYRDNGDGTVTLRGLARAPAGDPTPSTVLTLPVAIRPANKCRFTTSTGTGIFGALDINTDGTVVITDYTGNASWAALDTATYSLG